MGIGLFRSSSSFDKKKKAIYQASLKVPSKNVNPDPSNYKIIKHKQIGFLLMVMINYPDCTNYEGNKICVFKDISILDLQSQKLIDPHFTNNKNVYAPIARFEPTDDGWYWADKFCNAFHKN